MTAHLTAIAYGALLALAFGAGFATAVVMSWP